MSLFGVTASGKAEVSVLDRACAPEFPAEINLARKLKALQFKYHPDRYGVRKDQPEYNNQVLAEEIAKEVNAFSNTNTDTVARCSQTAARRETITRELAIEKANMTLERKTADDPNSQLYTGFEIAAERGRREAEAAKQARLSRRQAEAARAAAAEAAAAEAESQAERVEEARARAETATPRTESPHAAAPASPAAEESLEHLIFRKLREFNGLRRTPLVVQKTNELQALLDDVQSGGGRGLPQYDQFVRDQVRRIEDMSNLRTQARKRHAQESAQRRAPPPQPRGVPSHATEPDKLGVRLIKKILVSIPLQSTPEIASHTTHSQKSVLVKLRELYPQGFWASPDYTLKQFDMDLGKHRWNVQQGYHDNVIVFLRQSANNEGDEDT